MTKLFGERIRDHACPRHTFRVTLGKVRTRATNVSLYNYSTGNWDNLGSVSLITSDTTTTFSTSTNLSAYVSGGQLRARFFRSRNGNGGTFDMLTDQVKFTTVSR